MLYLNFLKIIHYFNEDYIFFRFNYVLYNSIGNIQLLKFSKLTNQLAF